MWEALEAAKDSSASKVYFVGKNPRDQKYFKSKNNEAVLQRLSV
jgi:hypothetical protein